MSQQEYDGLKEESEFEALEKGALGFDFGLFESGDPESGVHTQNDPENPFQRSNVVQRNGATNVRCTCVDIVHGQWGPGEPESRATLVVLLFRFDPLRRASRIISANIEFTFFDSQSRHRKNPEVVEISLNESFSLMPTKQTESSTRGSEGTVGGGVFGVNLSGTLKYEKRFDSETADATHIVGSIDRLGARFGPSNAASWTLNENATTKTGVPAAIRVGILLKRSTNDDFHCTVKLETKADLKSRIHELFGGREIDDPILFKTDSPPTNKLMKYDVVNLGAFDVAQVEDVTFTTMRNGVVKGQAK